MSLLQSPKADCRLLQDGGSRGWARKDRWKENIYDVEGAELT